MRQNAKNASIYDPAPVKPSRPQCNKHLVGSEQKATVSSGSAGGKKAADDAGLRESEPRFRAIFEHSGSGMALVDMKGYPVECNPALLKMLGYSNAELCRMSFTEFTHPDDRELDSRLYEELISGKRDGYEIEKRYITKDGRTVWGNLIATLIPDREGSPRFALGMVQDITERKLAEEQIGQFQESLRASEERFAKAFHACPEPIAIFHHRTRTILEVNERWQLVFGYTREEALGRTVVELTHMNEEDRNRVYELMDTEHSIRELDVELITKAGERRSITLSAEQLVINGELCDIYISRDVTERRRAESENRSLIHHLGERVKELTLLHQTARILQTEDLTVPDLLRRLLPHFPRAWQYPEITEARIRFGNAEQATPGFVITPWTQRVAFKAAGVEGAIEVVYREERPEEAEGPFLQEERSLLESLAEMLGSAFDRRFAQDAVRESEERFRQLMDNIREVFWMSTPDFGQVLYISPAYEKIWGRPREELYRHPKAFIDGIHQADRERVAEEIEQCRTGIFQAEYRVVRPDGSMRWVRDRGFPITDGSGRLYRIAGLAEDVTDRKEAERQLIASREQMRALSDRLRKAKEEEGIRISRELHDELGGSLTGLKWGLMAVRGCCAQNGSVAEEKDIDKKIEEMVRVIDATINTVRRISSELRPGILDDLGLISAIEWHARHFEANTGIACRFDSQIESIELDRERGTAIFRIYQEAMTNVLRHSRATKVKILIEQEENEFVFEICDNGHGIRNQEAWGTHSLGIVGMHERAHSIGGKIEITGVKGKGTTVTLRVPV